MKAYVALFTFAILMPTSRLRAEDDSIVRRSKWHGFERLHFRIAERDAYLVLPKEAADGNPWIWRARFPDFHYEMDVKLIEKGFHVAYINVGGLFGNAEAMAIGDELYAFMTNKRGLSKTPVLEGVSRGGLFVYNWLHHNPTNVSCVYCDTPVLDFKSWPAGSGKGIGHAGTWKACLERYKLTEEESKYFKDLPVYRAADTLVKHEIPVLHIVSENDTVVPPAENTYVLQASLKALGYDMPVISVPKGTEKSHGHHFTHPDPDRVVAFILKNGVR